MIEHTNKHMTGRMKSYALLAFLVAIVFGVGASGLSNSSYADSLTGSFTEAEESEKVEIEEVRWEFGNGTVVKGPIAKQNFSKGVHNVTVYVEKSDGSLDTYRAQIEVKR